MLVTEQKIWLKIHDWLPGYKVRIENSVSIGLPDIFWVPRLPIFLESKIKHGNSIVVRNSQIVFGKHIQKYIIPDQHLFIVATVASEPILCYTYNTIITKCPSMYAGESRQKMDVAGIESDFTWTGAKDVSDYLRLLEEKERNDRLSRVSNEGR